MYVLYLKVNLISGDEMVFMELGYLCPDGYQEKWRLELYFLRWYLNYCMKNLIMLFCEYKKCEVKYVS